MAVIAAPRPRLVQLRRLPGPMLIGGAIIVFVALVALLAGVLAPFPYDEQHYTDTSKPPGGKYLLGTDEFGRDVFSRVLYGSRTSLAYGLGTKIRAVGGQAVAASSSGKDHGFP